MPVISYRPLRTNVLLGDSRVRVRSCPPPRDLAAQLIEFWQYDVNDSEPYVPNQIYPSGVAVLRFDIGLSDVDASVFGPSLSSQVRGFFYRDVAVFGVAIHATHTASVLGVSASELRDLRVQLDVLWPNTVSALKAQLWQAQAFDARVLILADFLRRVLRPEQPDATFVQAFQVLVQRGGVIPVRDVRGLAASERTLRRQFARCVGLSPKQTARVIRFQHLLNNVVQASRFDTHANFARLAQASGYADQAHMIREFAQLVGVPPGKFLTDLPRLHDPRLGFWKHLSPENTPRSEPPIRRLGSRARAP